jgi:hypothetical protein
MVASLTTTQGWSGIGWSDTATMIVETGGIVNFAEHAWIGWDGNGTLILDGGTVNVAGMYGTAFEGQSGTGTTLLKKGTLNLAEIHESKSIPDGSVLNIELGVLKIDGDQTAIITGYQESGKITAFGGTGTLEVTFADDVTTVIAIPEKGATTVWSPGTNPEISDGLWSNYLNWSDRHVPGDNKVVFRNTGAIESVVDIESTIKQLVLGDGGEGMQTLHIVDGGSVTTTNGWSGIGWNTPGTLIVDTGGVFNFGSHAWVGWNSDAIVEINGGIINVGGMYGTAFEGQSGSGKLYLYSGELNLTDFHPEKSIPEGSLIDIHEGRIAIPGNHVDAANAYKTAGRIIGFGGSGQAFVSWDNDTTYISAKNWPVSANELEDRFTSKVYPNPTQGKVTLVNPFMGEISYTVYSLTGKIVHQQNKVTEQSIQIDLSGMKSGIYMFKISSAEKTEVHKVILQ